MTVLVTGASGHLGRLTVQALIARGTAPSDIVATARRTEAVTDLADLGVVTRRADYDDRASLDAALVGVDRVLLVSGSVPGARVTGHGNVIDAARDAGVSLVVYTSAPHADTATYALAGDHRATEKLLAASGVPFAVLRNGWYIENYTENAAPALASGSVHGAAGDGRVSAATRQDYAEAAAVVLAGDGHEGAVYELGGDEAFTMGEYAAALGAAAGRPVSYVDLPVEQYAAALAGSGVPEAFANILADSDAAISRGDLFDGSRTLSRLIGRPTTPLATVLESVVPA
jgi:NAD(P)H dehydrogenase (quinone)